MRKNFSEEELLQIVAERVRKFTSNESTSVTYTKARQIMGSILYCMEDWEEEQINLDENNADTTIRTKADINAKEAFQIGLNKKKMKIKSALVLYNKLRNTFCYYENECYRDTVISGMEGFFKVYDVEFDATNHILTLDYPLIKEVCKLKGIDLIYEYLYRTVLEQRFLKRFEEQNVIKILSGYHQNHTEYIINICKLVLRNVMGCMLINKPIYDLTMDNNNRSEIKERYEAYSLAELEQLILGLLDKLIREEFEDDRSLFQYLEYDVKEFAFELRHCLDNHCLESLFLEEREECIENTIFEDGTAMEDEELRKLIEKMSDIIAVEDKIELLKKSIKSLADLKEILLECFYNDEYNRVFELLSQEEIGVLQEEIKKKMDFNEELYEWEKELIKS